MSDRTSDRDRHPEAADDRSPSHRRAPYNDPIPLGDGEDEPPASPGSDAASPFERTSPAFKRKSDIGQRDPDDPLLRADR
jgi:hypothetical protein